jgi:glycosyltransferase involved in cell wall biosynthesis
MERDMKVEVLCATMFQKDFSKYTEMNIKSDVIFANQDDRHEFKQEIINGNTVKMVTTPDRGVGKNRNLALLYSSADILVFSDDDMVYVDDYADNVVKAYEELPDADIIIFNINYVGTITSRRINRKIKRVHLNNVLRYGFPRVTMRRTSIEKSNLWVSTLFGGGAKYCSGEDNLFLVTALKLGLKIYIYPFNIGSVKTGNSTWFTGYNEKYFFDNGAWLQTTFPNIKHLLVWYFVFKFGRKTDLRFKEIWSLHYKGMDAFNKGFSYDEWFNRRD